MEMKSRNANESRHVPSYFLFFIPITLGLFFVNCQKAKRDDLIYFESSYVGKGTRININPDNFVYPNKLHLIDSLLLVEDSDKLRHFRIVNISSLEVSAVGKMGKGPGELSFPTSIQVLPNGNKIGLCIRPMFVFGEFTVKDLLQDSLDNFTTEKRFDSNLQKVVKVNDSMFVSIGLFRKRYAVFNGDLKFVSEQHDYPFIEEFPNIRSEVLGMAYQGDIAVKPDGTKIVAVAQDAIHFQILNVNRYDLDPAKTLSLTYPKFRASEGNIISANMLKENVYGFLDVSVTNESVYLLYSGNSVEFNANAGSAAQTILVYSWEGEPKYKINLDRDVNCIAVDEDKSILYAIEFNKHPYLVSFSLPVVD